MKRRIINIDESLCNGCGACATACHEGAIKMIGGVARLVREDFCDGLGDCLPACPTGAISFTEREAPEDNEAAVKAARSEEKKLPCGCPGTSAKTIRREACDTSQRRSESHLMQWPCQIRLLPERAPYLDGARLLIAADCTAYAYGSFHEDFMRGHVTLIGCPKLDCGDWAEKLAMIIGYNDIRSVTVVRMEVPCCGGIENAVRRAVEACARPVPYRVVTISTDGKIIE